MLLTKLLDSFDHIPKKNYGAQFHKSFAEIFELQYSYVLSSLKNIFKNEIHSYQANKLVILNLYS
jgi:hypothetical protein